jgi:hypothetical protein
MNKLKKKKNGFYVGQPIAVAKGLGLFEKYQDYCKKLDYREWMVRLSVEENNLTHSYMRSPKNGKNYIFCKIRANLEIFSFQDEMHPWCAHEVRRIRETLSNTP